MATKRRVPLHQNPRGFVEVDPAATEGAILGVNLRDSAGNVIRPEDVLNQPPPSGGTGSISSTIWRLIREIPDNIKKLAALTGNGLAARLDSGEWALRTLQQGAGLEVENGDGDAGDPMVGLSEASLASLALADSALQSIQPGPGVSVDNTDPQNPIVSASGGAGGGILPVVTGEVVDGQPVFLIADDGSLIYTEII